MYSSVVKNLSRYWRAYGGWREQLRSPFLHLALLLLVLTFPNWSGPGWWELSISVLPSLLGFTLGGFAMFLGFGDEKFRAILAEPDDDDPTAPSLYVSLCATFVHFLIVQLTALIAALLAKAWWFVLPWPDYVVDVALPAANLLGGAVGYGLFLYAVTSILAATLHVFKIATWYEDHQRMLSEDE